ncbi:MAG: sulfatase [Verrucomicrobia bacterium]|nr:sulfatase [Verrucomicrobiota bacterium]
MKTMTRFILIAVTALALNAPAADSTPARPNILFVMSDDHAYHAISAYNGRLNQTPHLDRLAREGMRFDRCFVVNSICTPSRATILTGKYSHLNGCPAFNRFDGAQPTVAKRLQAAGYHTGMIGKWHLGSDPTGFHQWIILPGQGVYNDPAFLTPEGRKVIKGYATDVITDLGIDFLEKRPKDKPFFLMLHHKAPHREWTPDPKNREKFAKLTIPEPPTLWDDYATRTDALRENQQTVARDLTRRDLKLTPPPDITPGTNRQKWLQTKPTEVEIETDGVKKKLTGTELVKWKYQRYMQDYLGCIQSIDDNMGRLFACLERAGLMDNTVIFYTADNGFFLGDHGLYDKRFMYEESLRIPLLARWPGQIKAGSVSDAMVLNLDFPETFLELAGLQAPAEMQGRSFAPLLRGTRPADWRTSFYYRYYHDPGDHNTRAHLGVRTETHKLIHYWKKDQWELFDLRKDPAELVNLYNDLAQTATVAQLKKELARLKDEVRDHDEYANELPPPGVDGQPPGRAGARKQRQAPPPPKLTE